MKNDPPHPPGWAVRLLERILRHDPAGPSILGDLREEFAHLARERGSGPARRRYAREVFELALGRLVHRALDRAASLFGSLSSRLARGLLHEASQALRAVRRNPGFALFTAAVIGLGVGATTAVYSVLRPLVIAPLPFEDAHELVWIANDATPADNSLSSVTSRTANLHDFRQRARSFQGVTGFNAFFQDTPYTLTGTGEPERLVGVGVAHDFLQVLGVGPLIGRSFTVREGQRGGPPAVILSHGFWQRRFGGDPSIVGRSITLNGTPRPVVGVLPPSFDFSSVFTPGTRVDLLVPFPVLADGEGGFQGNIMFLVGRLTEGATVRTAQAELDAVMAALREAQPGRWGLAAHVVPLRDHVVGPFLPALGLLAAAAGTLLLVVCVNVSSLLLARAPSRAREVAVRKAMGASRARLAAQLVLESVGVAAVGAAIGAALAWIGTRVVAGTTAIAIPLLDRVTVDGSTLLVAAAVALGVALVVSSVPVLQVTEGSEASVLRSAGRGGGQTRRARRLREGLVVAEVGLACLMLIVSGLLVRSFRAVLRVDLGFEPAEVVAWQLPPNRSFGTPSERSDFFAALADRVEDVPGVEAVGLGDALPLGRTRSWGFSVVGSEATSHADHQAYPHVVDPGYLPTLGIGLVAGRSFTDTDEPGAAQVVLINESTARTLFRGGRALGRTLRFWAGEWEIVGIVEDVRHLSPEMGSGMEVYFPLAQMPDYGTLDLAVRSPRPTEQVVAAVSRALAEADPSIPTRESWTLQSRVDRTTSARRFTISILGGYGAAALFLAGLGIYGVLAQTVAERKTEIRIRMALGASSRQVVGSVLQRSLLLTGVGIALGTPLALAGGRLLDSLLFGVGAADPVTLTGMVVVLLSVAAVAAGLPARRAARTEGLEALSRLEGP